MELDPRQPRDALVAAGRERLLRHSIDALRSQLNASVLSQEVPVSRDTAYRVFRGDGSKGAGPNAVADAILVAVAEAAKDRSWGGYDTVVVNVLEAYQASLAAGNDAATNWKAALRAVFDAQFDSPGQPIGWMLQAAAMTASESWHGEPMPEEDREVASQLLETRRAYYQAAAEHNLAFMTVALSDLGRRPRAGWDPEAIVAVIHALMDGAVHRSIIEPDAFTADLFAESMFLLWMTMSEPGPTIDPRKPDDPRDQAVFDRLLDAAAELWQTEPELAVASAAERAGVTVGEAALLFPDVGDLADSLVRARSAGGGLAELDPELGPGTARQHLPGVVFALGRLRDFADAVPHAVAASTTHSPTRSKPFVEDFIDHGGRIVDVLDVTAQPDQLVRDLYRFASQGSSGWPSVAALLRTVGYEAE